MATTLPTFTPLEDSLFLTLYARACDHRRQHPILGDAVADQIVRSVVADQLARDGKTKPETAGCGAGTAIKFLEYFVFFTGLKPRPAISHRNHKHRVVARRVHFDRLIVPGVTGRIRE